MPDLQAIFDEVMKPDFIDKCFKDPIFPKIVVILADFLESY